MRIIWVKYKGKIIKELYIKNIIFQDYHGIIYKVCNLLREK